MAGVRTLKRSSLSFKLAGGKDAQDRDITHSVALADVVGSPDANDVISVSNLLAPCLDEEMIRIEHTRVDIIQEA